MSAVERQPPSAPYRHLTAHRKWTRVAAHRPCAHAGIVIVSQPDGEGQSCDRSHAAHTLRRDAEMLSQRRSGIRWNAQRMHAQSASVAKGRSKAHSVQPDCSLHSVPSRLASDGTGLGAEASAATSRDGAGSRHPATRTTTRTRTHATRRRAATSDRMQRDSVPTYEAKGRQDKLGGSGREGLGVGGRPVTTAPGIHVGEPPFRERTPTAHQEIEL